MLELLIILDMDDANRSPLWIYVDKKWNKTYHKFPTLFL